MGGLTDAGWLKQAAPALKLCLSVLLQAFVKITGARRVSHVFVPRFTPSKQQGQISRALIDTFSLAVVTFSTVATEKQTLQLELRLQSKGVWGIQFMWNTSIVQTFILLKITHSHSQCVRWSWDVVLHDSLPEAREPIRMVCVGVFSVLSWEPNCSHYAFYMRFEHPLMC